VEKRRTPDVDRERDALVAELLQAATQAVGAFDAAFEGVATLRKQAQRILGRS
jgi:hypothetical protein